MIRPLFVALMAAASCGAANARRMTLTARYFRQFGRDIALGMRDFLDGTPEKK